MNPSRRMLWFAQTLFPDSGLPHRCLRNCPTDRAPQEFVAVVEQLVAVIEWLDRIDVRQARGLVPSRVADLEPCPERLAIERVRRLPLDSAVFWDNLTDLASRCVNHVTAHREFKRIWEWKAQSLATATSPTPFPSEIGQTPFQYPIRPATQGELAAIVGLDTQVFADDDLVPESAFREWLSTDPRSFVLAQDIDGTVCGYYSLLFLNDPTLRSFVARGSLRERDIRASDLHPPSEHALQESAYVFSVVAPDAPRMLLVALLRNLASRISDLHERGRLKYLYAVAASSDGRRLMERAKFDEIVAAELRPDGHALWRLVVTNESFKRYTEALIRN